MARDKAQYESEIIQCIKDNNIFTIEMIFTFYNGISRSQFYELELNKSDTLKQGLDDNKNRTKHSMVAKWLDSDAPALQIALMKLICTDEEAHRLNGSKTVNENINKEVPFLNNDPLEADDNPSDYSPS
jgi:hypothetical protein